MVFYEIKRGIRMNFAKLTIFLNKWTTYPGFPFREFEYWFRVPYLDNNKVPHFVTKNGYLHLIGSSVGEEEEMLLNEERLIHPVILAQEIKKVLMEFNDDLIKLDRDLLIDQINDV